MGLRNLGERYELFDGEEDGRFESNCLGGDKVSMPPGEYCNLSIPPGEYPPRLGLDCAE